MELTGKKYGRTDWRKLLATRKGTAIVALVFAAVAAGILIFAMSRYRSSVDASGNPETVLVSTQAIAKATPGDVIANEDLFKPTQIVAKQVTAGAIADASMLHGKVAVRDINPGEQLTSADFTTNGGLPAQLAPNQRAMTITLDSQHGMLGQVNAGDHVDVYAGIEIESQLGRAEPVLRMLIPNVPVLKAGGQTSNSGIGAAGSTDTSQVTLKVPAAQAGALAYAADNGKIWLVLRPANATTSPPAITTVQSLLQGTQPISNGGKR